MRWTTAAVLDVCCVTVFATIGRASHEEATDPVGIAATAAPFLAGLAIGWAATRAWRRPTALVSTGLGVWTLTVAAGMVARALLGDGTAVPFIIVATVFVGATTLGWRAVARWAAARTVARSNS